MKLAILRKTLALCTIAALSIFARPITNGAPLKGVHVKLVQVAEPGARKSMSVIFQNDSGEEGKWSLSDVPAGTYDLFVSFDECVKLSRGPRQTTSLDGSRMTEAPPEFALDIDKKDGISFTTTDVTAAETTSKRQHGAITITKEWTATSPGLRITVTGKSKELTGHVTLIK